MPTTGEYPLVELGSVFFTSDGLDSGVHCRVEVEGLEELALTGAVQAIKALSGKPYLQLSGDQLGKPIVLNCRQLESSVYEAVIEDIQDAIDNGTTLELNITESPFGDFPLTVLPDERCVQHKYAFLDTRLYGVSFHFLTT